MAIEVYVHGKKFVNYKQSRHAICECCECQFGYKLNDIMKEYGNEKGCYYVACPECNEKHYVKLTSEEQKPVDRYNDDDYSY